MAISDGELFEFFEQERKLVSDMTDEALAKELLSDAVDCVNAAENEFAFTKEQAEKHRRSRGLVREAAFRIGNIRQFESN